MVPPHCSVCRKQFVRRAHRKGLIEVFLSLFFVYPFRCQLCGRRFLALQWGYRYVKEPANARQYGWIPVRLPVTFYNEHIQGEGTLLDLSIKGGMMETATPLYKEEVLCLRIPKTDAHPPIEIEVAGVLWVSRMRVGLEFLSVNVNASADLRRVIENLSTGRYTTGRLARAGDAEGEP